MRAKSLLFWEFIKLTRPLFLAGGVMLNLLGAMAALVDGATFDIRRLLLGQALITSVQLMTHYSNEFYDFETDRMNVFRTWFSGGSGVLARGALPLSTARVATIVFAGTGILFAVVAGLLVWQILLVGGIAILLAWSYSGPPLMLVKTGLGELSASLVVAGMVPLVGYMLQSGGVLRSTILVPLLPLILIHFAMLVAFQIPDREADLLTGKRTIAVRLRLPRVIWLHNFSLFCAFCVILALSLKGWPGAQIAWLPLPVAAWQIVYLHRLRRTGDRSFIRYHWLTMRALVLFASTTALWLAGVALFWIN